MSTLVLQYFDAAGTDLADPVEEVKKKTKKKEKKALLCRACGQTISSEDERIKVNDSHFHTCTNPAGFVFDIGCFRDAPGCTQLGPSSADHTWFAGYDWQIAICANCREHMGWLYLNSDRFYGLIIARLVAS